MKIFGYEIKKYKPVKPHVYLLAYGLVFKNGGSKRVVYIFNKKENKLEMHSSFYPSMIIKDHCFDSKEACEEAFRSYISSENFDNSLLRNSLNFIIEETVVVEKDDLSIIKTNEYRYYLRKAVRGHHVDFIEI